ncbi:MAG: hypothetical protein SFY32_07975 [Bacteroidota bacterium]|nr:hypothetical protein [Bacteroidota bacterium]
MLQYLIILFVSAIGSLPLGVINLTAVQITINEGVKSAVIFCFLSASIEFFHAAAAYYLLNVITIELSANIYLKLLTSVFILCIGLYNIFKKSIEIQSVTFIHALIINIFNPMAIPFWMIALAYLKIENTINIIAFSTTASFGGFVGLVTYVWIATFLKEKSNIKKYNINRIVGAIMLVIAAYTLIF